LTTGHNTPADVWTTTMWHYMFCCGTSLLQRWNYADNAQQSVLVNW